MNLLIISNNPDRPSFRQRIGIYLDTLQKKGINCEVAKLPPEYLSRYKLFKLAAQFDGVFHHKKCLNPFDAFLLRKYSKKIIYDFDDAVMYSPKNPDRNSLLRLKAFRRTVKLADVVTAGNSYLADHAKNFTRNVHFLPTGLDVAEYKVDSPRKEDGKVRLVWIGSKSTLRYLEEIKPALEKIGGRFKNIALRIICDKFLDLNNMTVEKHRWSLETQVYDLACSDVGIAPLPDDRFTRGKCGFKILQYQAAGLPVVTSPVGTNTDYVLENITGFFADTLGEWISKITELINNEPLRRKMGREGQLFAQKFDVPVIGKRISDIIGSCLEEKRL